MGFIVVDLPDAHQYNSFALALRSSMKDLERALEIAGTGIGVVFLALVALTFITILLTRYIKEDGQHGDGATDASTPPEQNDPDRVASKQDDDPAIIAAMVAAIRVVRTGLGRVVIRQRAPANGPASSSWRSQGRHALMDSLGVATKLRSRKR